MVPLRVTANYGDVNLKPTYLTFIPPILEPLKPKNASDGWSVSWYKNSRAGVWNWLSEKSLRIKVSSLEAWGWQMFCVRENGANIFYRSANYKLINVTIIQLFVLSKIPNLTKIKMVCLGVSLCRVLKSYQCRQVKLFKNIRLQWRRVY